MGGFDDYRYAQVGWAPMLICALAAFVLWGIALFSEAPLILRPFFVAVAAPVTIGAVLCSGMTVRVGQRDLTVRMGRGVLTYRVPLDQIDQLTVQPLAWWQLRRGPIALDGLGHIKILRVGGRYAVALRHKGRVLVIGTNDPNGLRDAITARAGDLPAAKKPVSF